jgi:hypothetical protein
MHPSTKICRYFPECAWGEECLYRHIENGESDSSDASQAQQDMKYTCKTCNNEFHNKNDMMMHKKREHPNTVNVCKDLLTKSCRKGPMSCWYHHEQREMTSTTTRQNIIRPPILTLTDFPQLPTSPRTTAVGNMSQELQQLNMLTQTMQHQQQQMAIMMTEILKLRI